MKVRWRESSLRLRIAPGELAALQAGEAVREIAAFPGGWSMVLEGGPASALHSSGPGQLTLTLDSMSVAELAKPDVEGVYFPDERFTFFVEKDFPCVHPRPGDVQESTETFAPPPGFAARHPR